MMKDLVQIDGSNFYNKVKTLLPNCHLTNFNYRKFIEHLTGQNAIQINYYVGAIQKIPGNTKSQVLYKNQQTLFRHLRKHYENCYIISSDTDLLPAILVAKTAKRKVIYIGFDSMSSKAMEKNSSDCRIVSAKEIQEFMN